MSEQDKNDQRILKRNGYYRLAETLNELLCLSKVRARMDEDDDGQISIIMGLYSDTFKVDLKLDDSDLINIQKQINEGMDIVSKYLNKRMEVIKSLNKDFS